MFEGKAGVIVGGTSGIGKATALAFARLGAAVVVSGRRANEGQQVVDEIAGAGGKAVFLPVDVADEASIAALIDDSVRQFGSLDFAVNNAARELPAGLLHERTAEECDAILSINVRGVFLGMKYQLVQMLKQGNGAIVNIASSSAHKAVPYAALYTATKNAIVGLTQAAAVEYIKQGIRINAMSPGVVDTETLQRYVAGAGYTVAEMAAGYPIGRAADPDEIAQAITWLCSPAASFVVGHSLVADGGMSI
ncbi:MAG: SDR family oxidoreductase [Alphaproteobacteria bacterium]|nr:SDR family oxidoreductase [Alphaproteobacteria bacterium]